MFFDGYFNSASLFPPFFIVIFTNKEAGFASSANVDEDLISTTP